MKDPFKIGGKMDREIYTCVSCGLYHKDVEVAGIHHCPNPLCTVSGNAYFRSKLSSYIEYPDGKHSVDPLEWLIEGIKAAVKIEDETIRAAAKKSALKMLDEVLK